MKAILFLMLLLLLAQASAMDPPVMEWEMQYHPYYYSTFKDIRQTSDSNMILAGLVWTGSEGSILVKMDFDGDPLWSFGEEWYSQLAYGVEELSDGSFIVTGTLKEQSTSSYGLFLAKVDSSGAGIWSHSYDPSDDVEAGYCVIPLPDGGYAACGRINGTGLYLGEAWILRTDSVGDTLWTDVWGEHTVNYAPAILVQNEMLVVLVYGWSYELPSHGPHLLFYDFDGNYLFGTDYPGLGGNGAGDICHASDGGFTFITEGEYIAHTDSLGNLLWSSADCQQTDAEYVNDWTSISQTMDGGYIVAGTWAFIWQPMTSDSTTYLRNYLDTTEMWGWLRRYDSDGVELWNITLNPGGNNEISFSSARQLSEGGYLVGGYYNDIDGGTGVNGYIVRYAPETGIDEWEESTGETLALRSCPNPSSGPVQISLTGPEGLYSLTVHDLSGRLVREYPEVPLGGAAALVWDGLSGSGAPLPAGVYIAELQTVSGSISTLLMRL
jgi:hypothetical protein